MTTTKRSLAKALATHLGARRGLRSLATLAALAAVACAGSDPSPEPGSSQSSLLFDDSVVEIPGLNPVMVTNGSCRSKGFRALTNLDECLSAQKTILGGAPVVSGQIDSPQPTSIPYGCAMRYFAVSLDPQYQLTADFKDGTQEELDNQECSHDTPCFCADDVQTETGENDVALTPVCHDGVFEPDPNKYYTIKSPNGRYVRATHVGQMEALAITPLDANAETGQVADPRDTYTLHSQPIDQVNAPADSRLQWRFVPTSGGYVVISRRRGQQLTPRPIKSNFDKLVRTRLVSDELYPVEGDPSPFTFTCRGKQVVVEQGGVSLVDAGGLVPDDPKNFSVGKPLVFMGPQSPAVIVKSTGCVKKSRTCEGQFGPEFVQIGRELCGFLNTNHNLKCAKTVGTPVSMHVRQGWYIEEAKEFKRALDFSSAPVTVTHLDHAADSLATFGISSAGALGTAGVVSLFNHLEAGTGPFYGALFSIGFSFLGSTGINVFNQPDPVDNLRDEIDEVLAKLVKDVDDRTIELIDTANATQDVFNLQSDIASHREFFYETYRTRRANVLSTNDTADHKDLRVALDGQTINYKRDINRGFPTLGSTPQELDLKRADLGLGFAKLALTELLIMSAETALLEAFASPELSCDQVIDNNKIASRATEARDKLLKAQAALLALGNSDRSRRTNPGTVTNGQTDVEFEFDVKHFSYPIDHQVEFFSTIEADTRAKCLRLRDPQDSFRDAFLTNTPASPPPEPPPAP